jgi:hypothetical protein
MDVQVIEREPVNRECGVICRAPGPGSEQMEKVHESRIVLTRLASYVARPTLILKKNNCGVKGSPIYGTPSGIQWRKGESQRSLVRSVS